MNPRRRRVNRQNRKWSRMLVAPVEGWYAWLCVSRKNPKRYHFESIASKNVNESNTLENKVKT